MSTLIGDLRTISASYAFYKSDDIAYFAGACPSCGGLQFLVIAVTIGEDQYWLRCIACRIGLVRNHGVTVPAERPLRIPAGLPEDVAEVWREIRDCLSIGAYSAAVLLCRKLLMHVAVEHGLPATDDRGRGPNFMECVEFLFDQEIVTRRMRPWVDRIREVGNEATHKIDTISEQSAIDVATFTQKLLELGYEMDETMARASSVEVRKLA